MSKKIKENEIFKTLDERLKANDEKGIDSIIVIQPKSISIYRLGTIKEYYFSSQQITLKSATNTM